MFIVRECLRSIRRSPISVVLIALTIGVGVGLTAVFAFVAFSAREELAEVQRSMSIDLYFDQSLDDGTAHTIFQEHIEKARDIRDARFITKDEALRSYEAGTGQDVRSVLGDNPLPAGANLRIEDPTPKRLEAKIAELRTVPGVAEALVDRELSASLAETSDRLDRLSTWLGVLMALVILVVVAVATRLAVALREQTLSIMRMLGATRWKVNAPFMLEGVLAGILGGIIATLVLLALDGLVFRTFFPNSAMDLSKDLTVILVALIFLFSALLGFVGSALALSVRTKQV